MANPIFSVSSQAHEVSYGTTGLGWERRMAQRDLKLLKTTLLVGGLEHFL